MVHPNLASIPAFIAIYIITIVTLLKSLSWDENYPQNEGTINHLSLSLMKSWSKHYKKCQQIKFNWLTHFLLKTYK